jgi:argininosuccinate lyase
VDVSPPSAPSAAGGGPAPELVDGAYAYEIGTAAALHDGLNLADMAHLLQLDAQGLVPAADGAALAGVLLDADATSWRDFGYDAAFGEPYSSRERTFERAIGEQAGWLHAGRTRREATRVAFRLHLRREVCVLVVAAARLAAALAHRAREHRATLFGDHTYLQQAQPSTIGHYLTSFAYPVLRDADRLLEVVAWLNGSPCGVGAVNGSRLATDRQTTADALGFDHVIVNTRDAMWQVDGLIQLAAAVASLACTETSLAEDLEIWSSSEFDYVELGAGYTRSSVLMPQKRNPYALSMVRGATGVLIGQATGLLAVQKSPSARSDSLIFAYGETPAMVDQARRTTELMAGVVETLAVDEARLRERLDGGFSQATDLADELMLRFGLDYRRSYQVVGRAVRALADEGRAAVDLTLADLDAAAREVLGRSLPIEPADLAGVLDPAAIVATRVAVGGAAPSAVDTMVDELEVRQQAVVDAARAGLARYTAVESELRARTLRLSGRGARPDRGGAT